MGRKRCHAAALHLQFRESRSDADTQRIAIGHELDVVDVEEGRGRLP
jgi:hypothetical protein